MATSKSKTEKGGLIFMYFKVVVFSILSFLMVTSGAVHADGTDKEHGHNSPHGGVIQEAEGMHAEFLLDKSGEPKLYLYDKAMKPLERSDLQTRLTVKGHDGAQYSRDLKATKGPKEGTVYKGEPIKGLTDWDTAVVSVKVKDQWTHIRFPHHADGNHGH